MEEEIIYFYNVKDGKYYQSRYTHRWLNNLQQQCKRQKEVIDKINNFCKDDKNFEILDLYSQDIVDEIQTNLLDILKEVSE